MSKRPTVVYRLLALTILGLQLLQAANGQTMSAEIGVLDGDRVAVTGDFGDIGRRKNPRSFAVESGRVSSTSISMRVDDLGFVDSTGKVLDFRKLMEGEYLADGDIARWRYSLTLTPSRDRAAAAHNSWLKNGSGILMVRDLIPIGAAAGQVCILHDGKRSCSEDLSDLVVPVGDGWSTTASDPASFISISGKWNFTVDDIVEMTRKIHQEHTKVFQHKAPLERMIFANFPVPASPGNWEAETRGRTVTIISSDMPFRTQSLQRLHEQLRHELFHLWIPNGVNLTGNYDWFYEGFALYRSLKLAVGLNRIRFEDFLDTLSRAHTIDSAQFQRTSLVQASATRFTGSNTRVYARGMLVAFMIDLVLLQSKRGSVEDVLREVYARHRKPASPVDGNTAVVAILKANSEAASIVDRFVTGSDKIEWTNYIAAAGIEDVDSGPLTTLRVKEKPGGKQKALLDKLGYNNWRKLSPNSK